MGDPSKCCLVKVNLALRKRRGEVWRRCLCGVWALSGDAGAGPSAARYWDAWEAVCFRNLPSATGIGLIGQLQEPNKNTL